MWIFSWVFTHGFSYHTLSCQEVSQARQGANIHRKAMDEASHIGWVWLKNLVDWVWVNKIKPSQDSKYC